ncbi:hypothetical protein ACQEVC_45695 [Plantactinospora sp. CA-294935]|uniref:hypothetical protein n=1 Tax=Plantactinospora sp. CA-294935 TaxID=3240012 RepID=UPI003D93B5E2
MNAIAIVRNLLAAGWKSNSRTEMCDGSVVLDGTRGDSTITADACDDGTTTLVLTNLTASQVAAALSAVGHMPPLPAIPRRPLVGWSPATRAAGRMLRRLDTPDLGDVASGRVPLPPTGGAR